MHDCPGNELDVGLFKRQLLKHDAFPMHGLVFVAACVICN